MSKERKALAFVSDTSELSDANWDGMQNELALLGLALLKFERSEMKKPWSLIFKFELGIDPDDIFESADEEDI